LVAIRRTFRTRFAAGMPNDDPLQTVQWVFLTFSILCAALLIGVLGAVAVGGRITALMVASLLPLLCLKWIDEYRGRHYGFTWDLLEAAAIFAIALTTGDPVTVFMLLIVRLATRGLTESTGHQAALTLTSTTVFVGAVITLRVAAGSSAPPLGTAILASGFCVASPITHILGLTLARLGRATERERVLRGAFEALSPALPDEELPRAAVDVVRSLIRDPNARVALAIGEPEDMRVAALAGIEVTPGLIGRKVNLLALSTVQRERIRDVGGWQVTGDELAALWPADQGACPPALFLAPLTVDGSALGLMLITGAVVPEEDRVTVATLVAHIALRLEASTMSRELHRRRSDQRLESLTRHTSDVITVIDRDGLVRYASPATVEVLGRSPHELIGRRLAELVHADDVAFVERAIDGALAAAGAIAPIEFRVARVEGGWRYLEAVGTSLLDNPDVDGVIVTIRDITERRAMEAGLRDSETNFRRLFDVNPLPMWLYDASTHAFLAVNDAAINQYGYSRTEFLAMSVDDLAASTPQTGPTRRRDRRRHDARVESQHRLKGGRVIDVEVDVGRLVFQSRDAVLMLARDVTAERELHRLLEHQTLHDPLTGLPNRRLFDVEIKRALVRAEAGSKRQPAIIALDLDGFKTVNDTLGHAFGDRVLQAVGMRLAHALRPGDTASRLAGDEFAVLLEDTGGADDAMIVAKRLLTELQLPLRVDDHTLTVSASVGVALPRTGHSEVGELIGDADIAMYVAKSRGTGFCVLFEAEQRIALIERLNMQVELSCALENDQLSVHYQPQLELSTGRVVAVEALVRWNHPTRGMIAPDVFLPVGEQMGLVPAIDAWVLATACRQMHQWLDEGLPPMRIAVNLSSSDLERADLVDNVRRTLLESMLDPWRLELELTESVAVGQPEAAVARLAALRSMGVRIAIDDFGTGYSMFSRLRDLPVDRLKIDRSFVIDLTADDDARAIVASTIAMGHALGLDLVAEGIENETTLGVLREMGCDTGQGYHLSRPLPADQLSTWLHAQPAALSMGRLVAG
jgi:diguanylate cyclase (GGDEF)-like protein/PAS domain S-box-containing protein